jgi:hypothetical protein
MLFFPPKEVASLFGTIQNGYPPHKIQYKEINKRELLNIENDSHLVISN